MAEKLGLHGHVTWELFDEHGNLKASGEADNLVTQVGEERYAKSGAGVTAPAAPTGMKLGTGSTAPAKTGAGAALVTYLANSHQAFDATFPSVAVVSTKQQVTYKATFAAGKATSASNPITEAVIVNNALTDATSAEANTLARVLLPSPAAKQAGDSLVVTWTHDIGS
jgi:hypothetical protein